LKCFEGLRSVGVFDVVAVGVASAGYIDEKWGRPVTECLSKVLPPSTPIILMDDLEAACRASHPFGDGVTAILGTGSNFIGYLQGARVRVDGWGHILGDEGDAYHIGLEAVRTALREIEGVDEISCLSEAVLEFFGVKSSREIIDAVYSSKDVKGLIASLAVKVFEEVRRGYAKAYEIIRRGVEHVAEYIHTVIKKLDNSLGLEIAVVGSVYEKNEDIIRPMLEEALHRRLGFKPKIRRPLMKSACGAVLVAAEKLGVLSEGFRSKLVESCAR